MGKVTRYLVILVVVCAAIVSFWIFLRYIQTDEPNLLMFEVKRGTVEETVRARGKVVTQKEYELAFPMTGTIKKVLVSEGQEVAFDTPLVELDTKDAELERGRLSAILQQKQANLSKVLGGARAEELKVYETKVSNAKNALDDAEKKLTEAKLTSITDLQTTDDSFSSSKLALEKAKTKASADLAAYYGDAPGILKNAFIKADDAVRQETESLFSNDDTVNPLLTFSVSDTQSKGNSQTKRIAAGNTLSAFSVDISDVDNASDFEIDRLLKTSKKHLESIKEFMDFLSVVLNKTLGVSDATLAAYKTDVNTGRANVNTVISAINDLQQNIVVQKAANQVSINAAEGSFTDAKNALDGQGNTNQTNLTVAQTNVNNARNALKLAQDELALQNSGNRSEEIDAARASVREAQNQLASQNETLAKSIIRAPAPGIVFDLFLEEHEVATSGQAVLSFSAKGQKVEADLSELDIASVREDGTQLATLHFDSYPEVDVKGIVMNINQKEIIKEGDTYYRINIFIENRDDIIIRSGMSADALIQASSVENVLYLPAILVKKDEGKTYVTTLDKKKQEVVEVETGVTNGDVIEIKSGVSEGQTVILNAD